MKKVISMIAVLGAMASATVMLTGCGVEYCSVSGCPAEAAKGCDYCYEHKCANYNCTNRGMGKSYSYCKQCVDRAN